MKIELTIFACCIVLSGTAQSPATDSSKLAITETKTNQPHVGMELYGFIITDVIYDFKQMDPNWYDVPRPTKLPAYKNQFAPDGQLYFSVRLTRFGIRGYTPTPIGELKTLLEFELFGTGPDAGQVALHLRHAYGEIGKFGAGQTWSPFVDPDVFPNDFEFWGPNGMANIRNIQIRYMPIQGDSKLTIALERPVATTDLGIYSNMPEAQTMKPYFSLPDLTAEYRRASKWGYIELAGLLRQLKWHSQDTVFPNLNGKAIGWGLNLSSRVKMIKRDILHLQVLYGAGIENYIRDAPADIVIKNTSLTSASPTGLPILGIVAFYDHYWSEKFSSTIGYSQVNVSNTNGQSTHAFNLGEYALANLIYTPAPNIFLETQLQYLRRKNFSDGWSTTDPRIQFSFRFTFSKKFFD